MNSPFDQIKQIVKLSNDFVLTAFYMQLIRFERNL